MRVRTAYHWNLQACSGVSSSAHDIRLSFSTLVRVCVPAPFLQARALCVCFVCVLRWCVGAMAVRERGCACFRLCKGNERQQRLSRFDRGLSCHLGLLAPLAPPGPRPPYPEHLPSSDFPIQRGLWPAAACLLSWT